MMSNTIMRWSVNDGHVGCTMYKMMKLMICNDDYDDDDDNYNSHNNNNITMMMKMILGHMQVNIGL